MQTRISSSTPMCGLTRKISFLGQLHSHQQWSSIVIMMCFRDSQIQIRYHLQEMIDMHYPTHLSKWFWIKIFEITLPERDCITGILMIFASGLDLGHIMWIIKLVSILRSINLFSWQYSYQGLFWRVVVVVARPPFWNEKNDFSDFRS